MSASYLTGQYEADLQLGVGAHVPIYCTGIGKALLASLGPSKQCEVLAALTLARHGPNTIMSKRVLTQQLACIRDDGLAICDEEQAADVRTVAAAIPHIGRSRPMALSVTVPAHLYTIENLLARVGPRVRAAAQRI